MLALVGVLPAQEQLDADAPVAAALPERGAQRVDPAIGPSAQETLDLEMINRFRADPAAEARRLLADDRGSYLFLDIDRPMFLREMASLRTAPPLVFNLQLLASARAHCQYVILNQQTHVEVPGRPGFSGRTDGDRDAAAGYQVHGEWAENVFRDAWDVVSGEDAFLVDHGGPSDPGGMQVGRGHRHNLSQAGLREIGIGISLHQGRVAIVQEFSSCSHRSIGGCVFSDATGAGEYRIGTGLGGVIITASDGSHTTTWASGAYTLPVHSDSVTLSATYHGATTRAALSASSDNQHWNWAIIPQQVWRRVDALLDQAAGSAVTSDAAYGRLQVALALALQGLEPDAERSARIQPVLGSVGRELAAAQAAVREAISQAGPMRRERIASLGQPYVQTEAAGWFNQAVDLVTWDAQAQELARALDQGEEPRSRDRDRVLQALNRLLQELAEPAWQALVQQDLARVARRPVQP